MARYAECMEEIKRRTDVVEHFLSGRGHAVYLQTTVEAIALQLRTILELIALASLVANREQYIALRERFGKDYRKDWNPRYILRDIERINPAFYPRPTEQVLDPVSGRVRETVDVEGGYLTRDDLESFHRRLGRMLHADNQFGSIPDYQAFLDEVPAWVSRIKTLLNHHQIQLVDNDHQLWVLMQAKEDGRAHVWLFERVGDLASLVLQSDPLPKLTRQEWLQALDQALDAGDEAWARFIAKANGSHLEGSQLDELNEDADAIGWVLRHRWQKHGSTSPSADQSVSTIENLTEEEAAFWERLDDEFPDWIDVRRTGALPTAQGRAFVRRIRDGFPEALSLFVNSVPRS